MVYKIDLKKKWEHAEEEHHHQEEMLYFGKEEIEDVPEVK